MIVPSPFMTKSKSASISVAVVIPHTHTDLDDGIRLGAAGTGNTVEANRVSGSSRDGMRAVTASI